MPITVVFRARSMDLFAALPQVHIAGFPADEGFVYFHIARQLAEGASLHRQPNTVEHEPRGLLRDLEIAGQFVRTDAVLAVDNRPSRWEPLVQAESGVLKDRSDLRRELALRVVLAAFPGALSGLVGQVSCCPTQRSQK